MQAARLILAWSKWVKSVSRSCPDGSLCFWSASVCPFAWGGPNRCGAAPALEAIQYLDNYNTLQYLDSYNTLPSIRHL